MMTSRQRLGGMRTVLRVPAIGATIVVRKRGLETLESRVSAAHDRLPHVVEAVDHVPVVVLGQGRVGGEAGVDFDDGEEAVQLVRHAGCEDGLVGPDNGGGEVVVEFWVFDVLEAHSDLKEVNFGAWMGVREYVPGIRAFQASSVSFVKNSEVLYGAYVWLMWKVVICVGTGRLLVLLAVVVE